MKNPKFPATLAETKRQRATTSKAMFGQLMKKSKLTVNNAETWQHRRATPKLTCSLSMKDRTRTASIQSELRSRRMRGSLGTLGPWDPAGSWKGVPVRAATAASAKENHKLKTIK